MTFARTFLISLTGMLPANSCLAQSWYPQLCCPNSCLTISEAPGVIVDYNDRPHGSLMMAGQGLPLSGNLFVGASPDNRTHVCIGYDSFGNKEIKCLFTPPIM